MLVNKANVQGVFQTLKTLFNKWYAETDSTWEKIAMKVPSNTSQNLYNWFSKMPKMRKWLTEKSVKALKAYKYVLVNDDFEATVEVDRNDIDDDQTGQYGPLAASAGQSSKRWPDEMVSDAVNMAFETECFDGQYFFDTDHPVMNPETGVEVSISNKLTAPLSIANLAAAMASYGAAKTMMMEFKDDEGRNCDCEPSVLYVPPALEDIAKLLMTADKIGDEPNPYKNDAEVVVGKGLTSSTAWFLFDTSQPIKPILFQERKAPVFVSQTDINSDNVFMHRKFRFGAEARGQVGYGFWQMAVGSTGAG